MKKKVLIPIIVILIVVAIICICLCCNTTLISEKLKSKVLEENLKIEQPKIKTFTGDDRPIAVMIDNNTNAWPQASVNKAYIIYEIIVEGGETGDEVDVASDVVDGRLLAALGTQDSNRLQMINNALDRIKQGTYGRCLRCGIDIPQDRLEAIPYAFMCIDCKSQDERRNR